MLAVCPAYGRPTAPVPSARKTPVVVLHEQLRPVLSFSLACCGRRRGSGKLRLAPGRLKLDDDNRGRCWDCGLVTLEKPPGADEGLNDQLRETFVRWYPGMQTEQE